MSVTLAPWGLSNPSLKPWVITVIVIIVISWEKAADVAGALVTAIELAAVLYVGHAVQQSSTATVRTDVDRL
ncbi:hypothetical protein [Streptomyces sp. WMMC905]|uniref:hypothetical protein n=1 Tax=Streptomyces sp. WMMC905 TaxID=3404123 RepID=UPI003B94582E